ncbi:MAG: helix-turn-helix domain-containing protein [Burkholderiaceae bacterium]|nr:helix-turn-helix domain-containing protein [Burkholderiaceae bacterium]
MSGITSLVDQLLGRARLPEGARPVTVPSLAPNRDMRPRNRKAPPKQSRDGRAKVIAALDRREARSVNELARAAGVSPGVVYDHLPGLLEAGVAVLDKAFGHRAGKRYRRGGR